MAARILAAFVHVTKDDGTVVVLKPGDELPKALQKYVTNDKVFAAESEEQKGTGTDTSDGVTPYDASTIPDLQAELKKRELPTSGNKAQLIARLVEHDSKSEADTADADLRAKLEAIGQPTDGTHDELVARLNEFGE